LFYHFFELIKTDFVTLVLLEEPFARY